MRVLTVPGRATTIINGALPSGFEESHQPRFWVLEFIIKVREMVQDYKFLGYDVVRPITSTPHCPPALRIATNRASGCWSLSSR
jgi:hypothetical protein